MASDGHIFGAPGGGTPPLSRRERQHDGYAQGSVQVHFFWVWIHPNPDFLSNAQSYPSGGTPFRSNDPYTRVLRNPSPTWRPHGAGRIPGLPSPMPTPLLRELYQHRPYKKRRVMDPLVCPRTAVDVERTPPSPLPSGTRRRQRPDVLLKTNRDHLMAGSFSVLTATPSRLGQSSQADTCALSYLLPLYHAGA